MDKKVLIGIGVAVILVGLLTFTYIKNNKNIENNNIGNTTVTSEEQMILDLENGDEGVTLSQTEQEQITNDTLNQQYQD